MLGVDESLLIAILYSHKKTIEVWNRIGYIVIVLDTCKWVGTLAETLIGSECFNC